MSAQFDRDNKPLLPDVTIGQDRRVFPMLVYDAELDGSIEEDTSNDIREDFKSIRIANHNILHYRPCPYSGMHRAGRWYRPAPACETSISLSQVAHGL